MIIRLGREMGSMMSILALGMLAMSLLQPVMPLYLVSIDISPEITGLMLSTAMIGMFIGEICWGWVADRAGFTLPIAAGTFISGLTVLCFVFAKNNALIFVIFFSWGLMRSALFGPVRGYIGANAPETSKVTFMAMNAVLLSVSRGLGSLPSGLLAENLGYSSVFVASSAASLAAGLVMLSGKKRRVPADTELPGVADPVSSIRSASGVVDDPLARSRSVSSGHGTFAASYPASCVVDPFTSSRPVSGNTVSLSGGRKSLVYLFALRCGITALQFLGLGVFTGFLPLLASEVGGISATGVGLLFTFYSAASMLASIPMGMLADRRGNKARFMTAGILVSGASLAGMALFQNFTAIAVLVLIYGTGMAMYSPSALALVSASFPPAKQSTAMGLYGSLGENLGLFAGLSLGGFVWGVLGPQFTFAAGAISCAAALALAFIKP